MVDVVNCGCRTILVGILLVSCSGDRPTSEPDADATAPDAEDVLRDPPTEDAVEPDVQLGTDVVDSGPADTPPDVEDIDALEDPGSAETDTDTVDEPDSEPGDADDAVDAVDAEDIDTIEDTEPDVLEGCPGSLATPPVPDDLGEIQFPPTFDATWEYVSAGGTTSAPEFFDLNADGVLDLLIGAGLEADVPGGVPGIGSLVALDGTDGSLIFEAPLRDETYTRPVLVTTLDPCRPYIVLGGRNGTLAAIDIDGDEVWSFNGGLDPVEFGLYNFYTPQVLADRNGDGVAELLVTNGGDSSAPSGERRPPGQVMVIDGATGETIARAITPDGGETYTSPAVGRNADGELVVYFGTGGETNPGAFWVALVDDVIDEDLSGAVRLLPAGVDKGVIAPPSLVDLTGDGVLDVVVATFEGVAAAIDGATYEVLWSYVREDEWETYSTPGIGHFDDDGVPDAFFSFSIGAYPTYFGTAQIAISGATGEVLLDNRTNHLFVNSPLLADLNGDGLDEVLVQYSRFVEPSMINQFGLYVPAAGEVIQTDETWTGAGTGTGAIVDLDGDGRLEWILTARLFFGTPSWRMWRIDLAAEDPGDLRWSEYLGTGGRATYEADRPE